jgi:uncharacterized membrane protein (DUF373 family)
MKVRKITKGMHPSIGLFPVILFALVGLYGIWNYQAINIILYIIGMIGCLVSIFIFLELLENYDVYYEKDSLSKSSKKVE